MNQNTVAGQDTRVVSAIQVRRNLLWIRYILLRRGKFTQVDVKALTFKGHEVTADQLIEASKSRKPPYKWNRLTAIQKCLMAGQYFDMLMHQHMDIPAAITIRLPVDMPRSSENRKFVYRRVKELLKGLTHEDELICLYWEDKIEGINPSKYDTLHVHGVVLLSGNLPIDMTLKNAKGALEQSGWYFHIQFAYGAFGWLGYSLKEHFAPNQKPKYFYLSPELIERLRDSFHPQIYSSEILLGLDVESEVARFKSLGLVG